MLFDLAVMGGGPAGCAAAITAARSGASVLLLERRTFPRHKVCGEFVSAESLGLLQTLLTDVGSLINRAPRISGTRIFLDGAVVRSKIHPPAASITRFDLDSALWDASVAAGVTARTQVNVRSVEGHGPFRIISSDQYLEAKAIINATGRWSNITSARTRARLNGDKWVGIKAHFHEVSAPNSVDLYFFEGGYCGVQPVSAATNGAGNVINACAMVRADIASTMSEVIIQDPILAQRSRNSNAATDPVTTAPLIFHEPEPLQNSMLQVGDAAMFVDPFIGDGISLALRSGTLAADCLVAFLRGQYSLEQACAHYSREYARRFRHIFNTSSWLRGLLRWPLVVRKPVLSVLAKTPLLTSYMVRMTR